MEAIQAQSAAKAREMQISAAADKTTLTEADTTFAGNITTATGASSNKSGVPVKKKGAKAKLSAKEKKERSVCRSMDIFPLLPFVFFYLDLSGRLRLKGSWHAYLWNSVEVILYVSVLDDRDRY